ncbi:ABC transporter substrate-binding protein [Kineococcus sp. SYSU DK002]|uniref:ABC transporter substrate-binding protein n=1 Tax=Kineococcus sp. SYSU DK002 TaxID=3383123 RepID=UPI003D7DA0B4
MTLTGGVGAAAFTASLAACAGEENPNNRSEGAGEAETAAAVNENGTIVAGISYELGTNGYDPMTTSAALTVAANWHTLEGLTEISPAAEREVYPALAAELPTALDDTTYEVTLREGAVFHDGTPVTADDVVFSFERVLDPANKSLYAGFIPFVQAVTAKDDTTVTVKLAYPFSLVAERLAVVKIVPRAAVTADPKAFDALPVGTGPYRMTDNGAASKTIAFERFEAYTGSRPALAAAMQWRILPDESTRTNALTSGAVQAIDSVPYLSIASIEREATVESVQGFGLLFAMFNCGSAPFADVRNRQAVLHAIDVEGVIATALLGNATPATCFVPEDHPAYRQASVVYGGDGNEAARLLGETGLKSVRLLCTDHDWVAKCTPIIKQNLEAAGLAVEFTQKKSADVYNTIDGKPDDYDIVIAPGDPSVFGYDADLLMRWWYTPDTWTDLRMHWKGQPAQQQVQQLLDEAAQQSGEQQLATWGQAFDLLSEEVPLYPLFHRKTPTAWNADTLDGFEPIPLTGLSFLDVASTN